MYEVVRLNLNRTARTIVGTQEDRDSRFGMKNQVNTLKTVTRGLFQKDSKKISIRKLVTHLFHSLGHPPQIVYWNY